MEFIFFFPPNAAPGNGCNLAPCEICGLGVYCYLPPVGLFVPTITNDSVSMSTMLC